MKHLTRVAALLMALALVGCESPSGDPSTTSSPTTGISNMASGSENGSDSTAATIPEDLMDLFTDRDCRTEYEADGTITLKGDSVSTDSRSVTVSGTTVTITDEGIYVLAGTLNDGMIIVDAEDSDKVQLVLNGVTIHSETSAPIYVRQADKVFLTLEGGTLNTLTCGESFVAIDENNIDAAIFSKDDLTLNGSGALTIESPAGHGIVGKDDLVITGGAYTITAASHGLDANNSVRMKDATITVAAGKDAIHCEHSEDASLGYIYLENNTLNLTAEGDGISAGAWMQIRSGTYTILSGGGSVNGAKQSSDSWGGYPGGMGGGRGPGGMGGGMGGFGGQSSGSSSTEEDSTSIKGLKATGDLTILGGTFSIDSADDAIHSNASISISGGTFVISSGDDGIHADANLNLTDGTITIRESYEGLEALHLTISGGAIDLTASDDGLNAAGGTDSSGFRGSRGGDMFGGGSSNGSILISGGTLSVNSSGDGLDANGTLEISGGFVTVCGPATGDTATLDYDTSGIITGGTFIGTGGAMMAQTFSDSEQGVFAVSVGSQSTGTLITLTDEAGNVLFTYTPEMDFAVVILSCPEMVKGQTYTITVGSASGSFEAS